MKQVPTWLTGPIFIFLALISGFTHAAGLHQLSFEVDALETDNYFQPLVANPLFEKYRVESNFLFSQNIADNYVVGLNYTDVTIVNDNRKNQSNSNLLVMLQFKF